MNKVEILKLEYFPHTNNCFELLENQIRLAVLAIYAESEIMYRQNPIMPVLIDVCVSAEIKNAVEKKAVDIKPEKSKIEPNKVNIEGRKEQNKFNTKPLDDFVFWFGKYKGRNLKSMSTREEIKYLQWCKSPECQFLHVKFKISILKYLQTKFNKF